MSTPSSSNKDLTRLLNGLSSPYAARRKDDAKTLGRVTASSEEIVTVLQRLAMTDPDSGVRQAALTALQAPVHQPLVERLKAQQLLEPASPPAVASTSISASPSGTLMQGEIETTSALTPATLRQWLAWTQLPPTRSVSPDDVQRLLKSIKDGSLDDRLLAIDQLRMTKPREAVPDLLKMAGGGLLADHERRVAAIMSLGAIGDAAVVPDLLRMKMLITAEEIAICCALAQIGSVAAIPHLKNRIAFPDLSLRAFSAVGLCRTGQAEAVSILLERLPRDGGPMVDAVKRLDGVNDRIKAGPFLVKFSGPSSATWLHRSLLVGRVGGAALGTLFARQAVFKNSFGLVNWHLDLAAADSAPADFAKMWLYHLWWSALAHLTGQCGLEPLLAYRNKSKSSAHRLLVELVALPSSPDATNAQQALTVSCSAKDYCERILAYEGWIRLVQMDQADARQRALSGLRDTDTRVRSAVGAAVLTQSVDALIPEALALANDSSPDVRSSLLMPLSLLAASGNAPAWDVIQQMSNRDADGRIRDQAARTIEVLAQDMSLSIVEPETNEELLPAATDLKDNSPAAVPIAAELRRDAPDQAAAASPRTTIYCIKCGAQNTTTHKFCIKCGQPLVK